MGTRSRYDRARQVADREAEQARALHTLAQMLEARPAPLTSLSSAVRGQIGQVFHMVGNELGDGRAVPVGVRRAVLALADAIRCDLDPRPGRPGRSRSAEPSSPTD